jgi:hypothetical protein
MPSILLMARFRPAFSIDEHTMPAILLLLLGTLAAAAAGPSLSRCFCPAKILGEFAITIGHSPVFMLSAATVSWGSI